MRPRVGHIQFINCFPLFYGLIEKKFLLDIDLIKSYPTELNSMLAAGKLDLAPISSISYAKNYKDYMIIPDISVSSDGAVKSIYLLSKVPIEELNNKKIALTNTSATSQVLLKILLSNYYQIQPSYFNSAPELGAMLMEADAALLIGDDALRAGYKKDERLFVYDLGEEWKKFTGLPMVFALWAVRKDFAENNQEILRKIKQTFVESIQLSLDNVRDVAEKAAMWEEMSVDYLVEYFQALSFNFDTYKQEGLLEYYRQAKNLGVIKEVPPLNFLLNS